jgi:hypothetical protein
MHHVVAGADAVTRRQFVARGLGGIAMTPLLPACAPGDGSHTYDDVIREMDAGRAPASSVETYRELVRCATLAASSHNTQPWKFAVGDRAIALLPDLTRRTPVVDPDDHHLFVSLGCATENLVHAALGRGLHADVAAKPDRIDIAFEPTRPVSSPLLDAIGSRQCSRSTYDGRALPLAELKLLEEAGRRDGVDVRLFTAKPQLETILEYVTRGNAAQVGDPAFVRELQTWIRFNETEAARLRDGLFSRSTGNPAVPRWLGQRLLRLLLTAKSENDKAAIQLRSSAGVAIFITRQNDPVHWCEAGRAYERFALQATALGIRNAFLNQPVEVAALRTQFAQWLDLGNRRPDLVVRFGRGPEMPRSLRRPVDDVLV